MKRKVVGFMLMAMMVVSMGTTVSAAETQDRGAELIQMEEEAQELDGFTGQAYVDLNTLGVNTQTVNPGGTFTVGCSAPNAVDVVFYYSYTGADGSEETYQSKSEDMVNNGGYWSANIHVPANAPAGVWRLETVQMFDGYNEDSYLWNTAVIPEIGQADLSCCNVSVGGAAVSPSTPASGGRVVPHYNMLEKGGKWNGQHYVLNGKTITDAFFFDGNYTYYLQHRRTSAGILSVKTVVDSQDRYP